MKTLIKKYMMFSSYVYSQGKEVNTAEYLYSYIVIILASQNCSYHARNNIVPMTTSCWSQTFLVCPDYRTGQSGTSFQQQLIRQKSQLRQSQGELDMLF